jgi:hypothetical protein
MPLVWNGLRPLLPEPVRFPCTYRFIALTTKIGLRTPQGHALADMSIKGHQALIAAAKGRAIRLDLVNKVRERLQEVKTDLEIRPEVLYIDDATNLHIFAHYNYRNASSDST